MLEHSFKCQRVTMKIETRPHPKIAYGYEMVRSISKDVTNGLGCLYGACCAAPRSGCSANGAKSNITFQLHSFQPYFEDII